MNEELIKILFKTKLQIIDCAEKLLPEGARTNIDNLKFSLLKAINEVTIEYLEPPSTKKPGKNITNINID
ncbi:hypothetical protein [Acetivibrio cellulolyticus]|uniref:hypothetical protein n=1 Tax=Acetivibrio cellulolyticus TaxID=35830 RepID=UPI0001E2E370|nr:hypothetical protein [Acetivibrio cellulolyticus]